MGMRVLSAGREAVSRDEVVSTFEQHRPCFRTRTFDPKGMTLEVERCASGPTRLAIPVAGAHPSANSVGKAQEAIRSLPGVGAVVAGFTANRFGRPPVLSCRRPGGPDASFGVARPPRGEVRSPLASAGGPTSEELI